MDEQEARTRIAANDASQSTVPLFVFSGTSSVNNKFEVNSFSSCYGGSRGSVLLVEGGATFEDSGSTFSGNSALQGGAIYVEQGSVTLTDTFLRSNYAYQGSAVYVGPGASLVQSSGTVIQNTAVHSGAYYFKDLTTTQTLSGVTFEGNQAMQGAAIYLEDVKTMVLQSNCIFRENKAS